MAALTIFLLACYLAIYTALAGYLVNRFCNDRPALRLALLYPLSWGLFEWLQGIVLTGFAWMQPGYSQIDTPLAGYAPLLGSHAVGMAVMVTAGALLWLLLQRSAWPRLLPLLVLIWAGGGLLKTVAWTEPVDAPIQVSLVQGNIAQSVKWKREMREPTLELYRRLSLQEQQAELIIWPETAVPGYRHTMRAYLNDLASRMAQRDTELLTGLFIRDHEQGRYYNSVINLAGGEYRKRHLVPLGEYMPLRWLTGFFARWIDIPMSDIAAADDDQPLLRAAGQPLGVSICFEDAFARDVLKDLPEATLLVNVSNDAWFEDSHAVALDQYRHFLRDRSAR